MSGSRPTGNRFCKSCPPANPADTRQPALIILDFNVSRHDGIEILQHIRDTAQVPGVPVVVLTSSDSPHDRQAATQLGVARFLQKPSSLDQFLSLGAIFKELWSSPRDCGKVARDQRK